MWMRTSFRLAAVTLVFAVGLSLGGCAPDAPAPKPTASPSATPLFATDEEALAAAEEAYAAYQAMSDAILVDGGEDPERLLNVATEAVYKTQLEGYKSAASKGWVSTGGTTIDTVSLVRYDPLSITETVTVYACIDVSDVDVVDRAGNSVVSESRPDRTPVESTFDVDAAASSGLIFSGEMTWSGENFCV